MKKNIVFLALLISILVSGCASYWNELSDSLAKLYGRNIRVAYSILGYPSKVMDLDSKTKLYIWERNYTGSIQLPSTQTGTATDQYNNQYTYQYTVNNNYSYNNYCTIKFEVDDEGIIKQGQYNGNIGGCDPYKRSLRRNANLLNSPIVKPIERDIYFGAYLGMMKAAINEVVKLSPRSQEGLYYSEKGLVNNNIFSLYIYTFSKTNKLCSIGGIIDANKVAKGNLDFEGDKLKAIFEITQKNITQKYGNPVIEDILKENSKLNKPTQWMESALKGDRTLKASWLSINDDTKLPKWIKGVVLYISVISKTEGGLILQSVLDEPSCIYD